MHQINMKKDFLSITDLGLDINTILELAVKLKTPEGFKKFQSSLTNKSMAMIFEKSSTRTRVSFEVAMTQLGGHSLFLNSKDLQLSRGETVADTARVISRFVDIIMYRAFDHKIMIELAKNSTVPVINALDDIEHPCQIIADFLTIMEYKGRLKGLNLVYLGDGNNVCNSLLLGSSMCGVNMKAVCPEGFLPTKEILDQARQFAEKMGCNITATQEPDSAVKDADVIYTDTWVSMGDETEVEERRTRFKPYQVNSQLVAKAKSDYIFMHCLPAHRGEEVTDDVMDSENSVVFDQAENRLHAQKAIILYLLEKTK